MKALSEFSIIQKYFQTPGLQAHHKDVIVRGSGDDAALLNVPAGCELVVSTDTLVAGNHFLDDAPAVCVAQRALLSNLSDLAAMGAKPICFLLNLTLPTADEIWLEHFSQRLTSISQSYELSLIGGDVTRGALSLTISIYGFAAKGKALERNGARVGDSIYVSGFLGDAAAGLMLIQDQLTAEKLNKEYLVNRYYQPEPRLSMGQWLQEIATAAIDISDGLAADLTHVLQASHVGANIAVSQLPISSQLLSVMPKEKSQQMALTCGDDYELCFTVPAAKELLLQAMMAQLNVPVTKIGVINDSNVLRCFDEMDNEIMLEKSGFRHF